MKFSVFVQFLIEHINLRSFMEADHYEGILKNNQSRKCWIPSLIFLNLLAICSVIYVRVSAMENQKLAGSGINNYCQRSNLTEFDRSLCFDDRHKGIFFYYVDGAPYLYYDYFRTESKLREYVTAKMSDHRGRDLSGMCFRSSLIGRQDMEVGTPVKGVDNTFHQMTRNGPAFFNSKYRWSYPVMDIIGKDYMNGFTQVAHDTEGIYSLCEKRFFFNQSAFKNECVDIFSCQMSTIDEAVKYETELIKQQTRDLTKSRESIKKCMDNSFTKYNSLLMYMEKTDGEAHDYSILSKRLADMHARNVANIEMVAQYFIENKPDTLLAIYSDHGAIKVPYDTEWSNHGGGEGDNKGFLMLMSSKYKDKPKTAQTGTVLSEDLFSALALEIEGANLPRHLTNMPYTKFDGDKAEQLKVMRAREMQLEINFGTEAMSASPLTGQIDTSKSLKTNIEQLDDSQFRSFAVAYRQYLLDFDGRLEKLTADMISDGDMISVGRLKAFYLLVLLIDVCVIVTFYLGIKHGDSKRYFILDTIILLLWFFMMILSLPIHKLTYPWLGAIFFLVLSLILYTAYQLTSGYGQESDYRIIATAAISSFKIEEYQKIYKACAVLGSMLLISAIFSWSLDAFNLYYALVYYLSSIAAVIGLFLISMWVLFFLRKGWEHKRQLDFEVEDAQRDSNQNWSIWYTFMTLINLGCVLLYEKIVFVKMNLEEDAYQMALVRVFELTMVLALVCIPFFRSDSLKYFMISISISYMAFWATHYTKILYSLVVIPALYYITSELKSANQALNRTLQHLIMISQLTLYTANRETYEVVMSQRAFHRSFFEGIYNQVGLASIHICTIKLSTAIVVGMFVFSLQGRSFILATIMQTTVRLAGMIVFVGAVVNADRYWEESAVIFLINALLPVLMLLVITLWTRDSHSNTKTPYVSSNDTTRTESPEMMMTELKEDYIH